MKKKIRKFSQNDCPDSELDTTYKEFDVAIKQVFVKQANEIIKNKSSKVTDAAVSIVSGLSRTYVTQLINNKTKTSREWISIPARTLATWVAQDLEPVILDELVRLKQVSVTDNKVTFIPVGINENQTIDKETLLLDFTDNLQARALAGIGNLTNNSDTPFLEQAVKVDGIHKYQH
ncbi:hypothetical protein CVPH_0055 [Abyssogena phaseoliformis symbiont OG214]|uniref:hypothetical protein n=1 Tax=Abyssogena phaseoliformis symbiont TaxID=596095 RepID=UPI0019162288|nr:hypothetical protein [Abyssogena phaseoliformis symbiont]BBB22255.1 hypothetical protein CVPH_0055 [Abyssogena phaseoliformis symbiont OG214]